MRRFRIPASQTPAKCLGNCAPCAVPSVQPRTSQRLHRQAEVSKGILRAACTPGLESLSQVSGSRFLGFRLFWAFACNSVVLVVGLTVLIGSGVATRAVYCIYRAAAPGCEVCGRLSAPSWSGCHGASMCSESASICVIVGGRQSPTASRTLTGFTRMSDTLRHPTSTTPCIRRCVHPAQLSSQAVLRFFPAKLRCQKTVWVFP